MENTTTLDNEKIIEAIQRGDIEQVEKLLKGTNLNDKTIKANTMSTLHTPLQLASQYGQLKLVNYLLDKKVNLEIKTDAWGWGAAASSNGETALHFASKNGHLEVVKLLVEKGANLNARTNYGSSPLQLAANENQKNIVTFLLEKGATPEGLSESTKNGNLEMVKILLDSGINVNSRVERQRTPLIVAAINNQVEVAKLLLERGADINQVDGENEESVLHWAAFKASSDVAKLLVDFGAGINRVDPYNRTPLLSAINNITVFHVDIEKVFVFVKLLIERGADINIADRWNETPLSLTDKRILEYPLITRYLDIRNLLVS